MKRCPFCLILPYVFSISSLTFRFNCKQRLLNTFELFNPLGKQKAGFISYIIRVCFVFKKFHRQEHSAYRDCLLKTALSVNLLRKPVLFPGGCFSLFHWCLLLNPCKWRQCAHLAAGYELCAAPTVWAATGLYSRSDWL